MPSAHRILDPSKSARQSDNLCALAVMTKAPRAGQVKTRLVPPLTHQEAAVLNASFLRDTSVAIGQACRGSAIGVAVYTPVGSEAEYAGILPPEFQLLPQRGDGFGERLAFAVEDLLQCGFSSVCLIDSDSPTVSSDVFAQAVTLLSKSGDRVVLGPSDDGGYYLIGLKQNRREMFQGIDWSTEKVFAQTRRQAEHLNLEVALLPVSYDVDDAATLRRLCEELLSSEANPRVAPATRKYLAELRAKGRL